jgi:hypothetical protein
MEEPAAAPISAYSSTWQVSPKKWEVYTRLVMTSQKALVFRRWQSL